jgi:hypothetical protein
VDGADLLLPAHDDHVGVESEVRRVVAKEALGVDVARQLLELASLQGVEEAGTNAGISLRRGEVDALALARGQQQLTERR